MTGMKMAIKIGVWTEIVTKIPIVCQKVLIRTLKAKNEIIHFQSKDLQT